VVNSPATVAGTSEMISARSRFNPLSDPLPVPSRLMSQKTPDARKPFGATIDPRISVNFIFSTFPPRASTARPTPLFVGEIQKDLPIPCGHRMLPFPDVITEPPGRLELTERRHRGHRQTLHSQ